MPRGRTTTARAAAAEPVRQRRHEAGLAAARQAETQRQRQRLSTLPEAKAVAAGRLRECQAEASQAKQAEAQRQRELKAVFQTAEEKESLVRAAEASRLSDTAILAGTRLHIEHLDAGSINICALTV